MKLCGKHILAGIRSSKLREGVSWYANKTNYIVQNVAVLTARHVKQDAVSHINLKEELSNKYEYKYINRHLFHP